MRRKILTKIGLNMIEILDYNAKNVTGGNNYKLNNKLERSNLDTGTKNKPARIKKKIIFCGKDKVH